MDLDMIPMTIESLALGLIPQPSVLSLRPSKALALPGEEDDDIYDRVLPIWIGPTEAAAIAAASGGCIAHPENDDIDWSTDEFIDDWNALHRSEEAIAR